MLVYILVMEDRLVKLARIVDAGSFTKAAASMHISQPALTTAVQKLERELQANLLIRDNHALTLTPAGCIAYNMAKTLLAQSQNLQVRIREVLAQEAALAVGMIDSIADLLFVHGAYLQQLERASSLSLSINNSSRLLEEVAQNTIDVALVAKPERIPGTLAIHTVGEEPLVLVTHADNFRQTSQDINHRLLPNFLSYNQASRTAQRIAAYFTDHNIVLRPRFFSTSPELMLQLVVAGRGIAVLPYLLVQPHITNGTLAPVPVGKSCIIMRTIVSIQRRERELPGAAASLIEHTKEQLLAQAVAAKRL